ncbi:MAG: hypothetical protein KDA81_08010 [Planctomycetaceae bacterium]|nr:hypothetical protein [Planctomycetaceae bacterium]
MNCRILTPLILHALILTAGTTACCADEPPKQFSQETLFAYGRFDRAIQDLDGYLRAIGFQKPATLGTNYFAVSVGGIDAIRDLEESRGVDPETLAGLYAGYATPEVARHLNLKKITNERGQLVLKIEAADGRLRYKNSVVRMYSPERLRELFALRETFRVEPPRERRHIFGTFVFKRQHEQGDFSQGSDSTQVTELSNYFRILQPIALELDTALRNDAGATTVLAGGTSQHFFGYSIGGIDVLSDLQNSSTVDPETYAAIYAGFISPDHADAFQYPASGSGPVLYDGNPVKLYSIKRLEECFRQRDRMGLLTQKR